MDTTAVPVVNVGSSSSPWEVLAATRGNNDGFGFGSGGGLIGLLLILFLVGGMGGNGLWGNRNGNAADAVLGNTTISTATGITGIQSTLNCQDKAIDLLFSRLGELSTQNAAENVALNGAISRFSDQAANQNILISNGFCNLGYQTQLGFSNLGHQLQECCCATQQSIANLNNNMTQQFAQLNYNSAMQNCELKQAIAAEGCATRQLIMNQYTEDVERKLQEAKTQLFFLQNCKTCTPCPCPCPCPVV